MARQRLRYFIVFTLTWILVPTSGRAQSLAGSISGTITDPSGAVVPDAGLTLKSVDTGVEVGKFTTRTDGLYHFGNLSQGTYQLRVSAKGFREFVQSGITIYVNQKVTLDVKLEVGAQQQTVEVRGNASPLNFVNAEIKQAIPTRAVEDLPLQVAGNPRTAANFTILLPGVTTGPGGSPYDIRVNGGQRTSDETLLDAVSMQTGVQGTGKGIVTVFVDMPIIPEEVGEVSVLTSNYDPQYGDTASSVITMVTKSGKNEFHGEAHEFLRNTALNARQFGIPQRPVDIENDFGASIGGPAKIPGLWGGRRKTFFYFTYDRWVTRGGLFRPTFSFPPPAFKQGDFSNWVDSSGKMIPVFDPATTRPNPSFNSSLPVSATNEPFLRDQFMGCNGTTPNVICPTDPRMQNSLAKQWLMFFPDPNLPGLRRNYAPPSNARTGADHRAIWAFKIDHHLGEKDHFAASVHYNRNVNNVNNTLPLQITRFAIGEDLNPWIGRLSWDHTFSPTMLNTVSFGYRGGGSQFRKLDIPFVKDLPQIKGFSLYNGPPTFGFDDFIDELGGGGHSERFILTDYIVNDLATKVLGKHTLKFGGEYRALQQNQETLRIPSGAFGFSRAETGLPGILSGSDIASFLLGLADFGAGTYDSSPTIQWRAKNLALHVGDTWKATRKLTASYGLRWEVTPPLVDKFDRLSWLDPVGSNPGAGGRPGRLSFAGTKDGAASAGVRHPEETYFRAFSPRFSLAYAVNDKTVVRTGYGIATAQASNWPYADMQQGFNLFQFFFSPDGGFTPAFTLSNGVPQNFQKPPFIDATFSNGKGGPAYRSVDANRPTYTQQWNLTIERQFTNDFYISAAYVGNKGTRLNTATAPINAVNPSFLSLGQKLYDGFAPGQTVLDGVPVPYSGWSGQLSSCAPIVAQALVHFPQYCGALYPVTEPAGNSSYQSFQFKAEKRMSHGSWLLAAYTVSKTITNADLAGGGITFGGAEGTISPFERHRNKALSLDDVPQIISISFIYELPFGKDKRFLNKGGVVNKLVGGWEISNIFRASAGIPFFFRIRPFGGGAPCNVPQQFRAACIPAILPGANPFLQDPGSYDPGKGPLFNKAAFEDPNSFNFYLGQGPRVSNVRGQGFHNQDITLMKTTSITEKVGVQFRANFFNAWNWHMFNCPQFCTGTFPFNIDVASPGFGSWNGSVTNPRNIQFAMKILF